MSRVNKYIVIGHKRVDYTKKSGDEVHGCEVFLQAFEPDEGVNGTQAEAIYLSDRYATFKPEVGLIVKKAFNQWGGVEDLQCTDVPQ